MALTFLLYLNAPPQLTVELITSDPPPVPERTVSSHSGADGSDPPPVPERTVSSHSGADGSDLLLYLNAPSALTVELMALTFLLYLNAPSALTVELMALIKELQTQSKPLETHPDHHPDTGHYGMAVGGFHCNLHGCM
ncbi:Kinesin-like protein KIF2A [Dissostichus eleginoides]|uniref:Kinesin-like protein KIF2A n=1 Tax=Dissostichus eleginoides TaxID=100907 RepID=A0AAD9BHL7_DISEL|nr:Kinesin-like protein KIF2A [Dissostichus eleginoides]